MNEYARILQGQNQGIPCPYCASLLGHYSVCGLLNRQAGEARAATQINNAFYRRLSFVQVPYNAPAKELVLTPDDVKLLAEMKIKA